MAPRPIAPLDEAAAAAFLAAIRDALPGLRLLTDEVDRESHRRDETAYLETGLPLAVALPTTTEEVAARPSWSNLSALPEIRMASLRVMSPSPRQ